MKKKSLKLVIALVLLVGVLFVGKTAFSYYQGEVEKKEAREQRIVNEEEDWIYNVEPEETIPVVFFGENNQNQLMDYKVEQKWYYKNDELILEVPRAPEFDSKYYVQEVSQKRYWRDHGEYPIKDPAVKQFDLLVYHFQNEEIVFEKDIDLLSLFAKDHDYQGYIPQNVYKIIPLGEVHYIKVNAFSKEDPAPGHGVDVFIDLETEKIEKDEKTIQTLSNYLDGPNEIYDFFQKTDFEKQWDIKAMDITDFQSQDPDGMIELSKYEADLSKTKLAQIYPEIASLLTKDRELTIYLCGISLETLLTYLVPEGKNPFEDAAEPITYTVSNSITKKEQVVIHSLDDFYELEQKYGSKN